MPNALAFRKTGLIVCACMALALAIVSNARLATAEPPAAASVAVGEVNEWFEREIRPLLAERCLSCHSSGLEAPKANLKLDRRDTLLAGGDSGPAIVPGKPAESLLMQAVRGEGLTMPPDKPLSKPEMLLLQRWIELGAPWPEREIASLASGPDWLKSRTQAHWAWQAMRDSQPPVVSNSTWPARPLDAFVHNKLERLALQPATTASSTQLVRRLAFDLTGLPPTSKHVSSFESINDEAQYARVVDELLASPNFGVTWGRHWLDLVRYCETLGHEFDYPLRHAWRYRDAVVDSINVDVSYATFVTEHIAGDLVVNPRRHAVSDQNESLALTGWWWMGEGLHAPVDVWGDEAARLDNQIDVYSKAFLGLTIACARCHDHKFDAISAADYTSLVGVLQSTRRTYAMDDPHGAIGRHNREMIEQTKTLVAQIKDASFISPGGTAKAATGIAVTGPLAETQPGPTLPTLALASDESVAIEAWIARFVEELRKAPENTRKSYPLHHPLFPLVVLAESQTDNAFNTKRRAAVEQLNVAAAASEHWQNGTVLLADFADGLPAGWYVEAADSQLPQLCMHPFSLLPLDPITPLPAREGCFTSLALGKQQQLALRSPTFPLSHPMVAMRMRGKSMQSSIVVDNYFMNEFQGLLFGDLRKPIDQPHDWGWVTHAGDLNKYIGHPAYVSLEDDENAWFELSEVRLCHSAPPMPGNALTAMLLAQSDLTPQKLMQQLASKLNRAWRGVTTGPTVNAKQGNALVELLRAAIIEGQQHNLPLPIAALQAVERQPLEEFAARTPAPIRLIATHEGTPRNAAVAIRGNPHARGDVIQRSDLQAVGGRPFNDQTSSGRAEMAASLTSGQHPLAARVMVNRVWLTLFGQGLVDSPDNFGLLGGAPSNLELLDYLTLRFMEHDWSVKWLVREICLSRTYRLSSIATEDQLQRDPSARFLSHRQVRRLSAEKLRDAMLAISGSLDSAQGGESVRVHLTDQMSGRGRPERSGPLDGAGRRSVFVETRRNFLDPFLIAFDQPPPATTVGKRNLSNVPAQALSMLNDPLVHELARRWSARLMADHASKRERIQAMYMAAFARIPTDAEMTACLHMMDDSATHTDQASQASQAEARLAELAHVLLCTKEFQYLR